ISGGRGGLGGPTDDDGSHHGHHANRRCHRSPHDRLVLAVDRPAVIAMDSAERPHSWPLSRQLLSRPRYAPAWVARRLLKTSTPPRPIIVSANAAPAPIPASPQSKPGLGAAGATRPPGV